MELILFFLVPFGGMCWLLIERDDTFSDILGKVFLSAMSAALFVVGIVTLYGYQEGILRLG